MKKAFLLLPAAMLMYGCPGPVDPPLPPIPPQSNPLAGFRIMSTPRSDVPIGAVWIQHTGPQGAAAAPENVRTDNSVTTYSFNSTTNNRAALEVADLLGIGANQIKDATITINGLKVTRVVDVFTLGVSPGQNVLFEALKADSITLDFKSTLAAGARAALQAKGIPVSISGRAGGGTTVQVNSAVLYIAYRVLKLEELEAVSRDVRVDGTAEDVHLSIPGYDVSVDASSLEDCLCGRRESMNTCLSEPIRVAISDPQNITLGGGVASKVIDYTIRTDWSKNFPLWSRREMELDTGSVFVSQYFRMDLRNSVQRESIPESLDSGGRRGMCEVRFPPFEKVGSLREITYEMKPLVNPVAQGW